MPAVPSPSVDLVFVLDASASMAPCFEQVKKHLHDVIKPMQGHVSKVNFALIAAAASQHGGGVLHNMISLLDGDLGMDLVKLMYKSGSGQGDARDRIFTSDPDRLIRSLDRVETKGDEDMLLALDFALDLPFGPVATTKRVIALFSDEPFESGVTGSESNEKLPQLIDKIQARHVQLFAAIPDGPGASQLASVDRAELEIVGGQGGGLADVDFSTLFAQMGKSISGSSLQLTAEPTYQRALFGQDSWGEGTGEMTGR
jgi:hypothetical protein